MSIIILRVDAIVILQLWPLSSSRRWFSPFLPRQQQPLPEMRQWSLWTFNRLESSLLQRCKAAACCKKVETCWSCRRAGAHLLMAVQTSVRLHSSSPAAQFAQFCTFYTILHILHILHNFAHIYIFCTFCNGCANLGPPALLLPCCTTIPIANCLSNSV